MQGILDKETWVQIKIPKLYQEIIEYLHNPQKDTTDVYLASTLPSHQSYFNLEGNPDSSEILISDDEHYCLVSSSLVFLGLLFDFIKIFQFFPQIAIDSANKLFELIKV